MSSKGIVSLLVYDALSGRSRTLTIAPGMSKDDLQEIFDITFDQAIVGVKDFEGIIYPIAGIVKYPNDLVGKLLETVTLAELKKAGNNNNTASTPLSRTSGTPDLFRELKPLTLQESIKEIQIFTGLGELELLEVVRMLPQDRGAQAGDTGKWPIDRLPLSIDRQAWLELMTDLATEVRPQDESGDCIGPPPDEELLNLLFDVLSKGSRDFRNSDANARRLSDTVDVSVLASGLSLLCGGEESANMYGVFLLHAQRTQSHWAGVVPELAVYHHLCALFRLIFQLYSALGDVGLAPEELARRHAAEQLGQLPTRTFLGSAGGQAMLSADEFCLCCMRGLRSGLSALYNGVSNKRAAAGEDEGEGDEEDEDEDEDEKEDEEEEEENAPPHYDDEYAMHTDHHFPHGEKGVHFWELREVHHEYDTDHHFPEGRTGTHLFHGHPYQYDDGEEEEQSGYSGMDSNTNDAKAYSAQSSIEGDSQVEAEGEDHNPLEDSLVAASLVEFDGGPIDVSKAQQLLGLRKHDPVELLSSLVFAADEEGTISLSSYHRLMDNLLGRHYALLTVLQRSVVDYIVAALYSAFTDEGLVDETLKIEKLGWALLPFTGGSPQAKAEAATQLLGTYVDLDLQDGVTVGDMSACLGAVLSGICALDYRFLAPLSAEQVSTELTMHAFTNRTDSGRVPSVIDLSDFQHWFSVVMQQFDTSDPDELSRDGSVSSKSGSMGNFNDSRAEEELEELRSSVCSGDSDPSQLSMNTDEWMAAMRREQQQRRRANKAGRRTERQQRDNLKIQTEFISDAETEDSEGNFGFAAVHPEPEQAFGSGTNLFPDDMDDSDMQDDSRSREDDESGSDMPSDSQSSTEDLYADYNDDDDDDDDEEAIDWETEKLSFQNGKGSVDAPTSSSAVVLELRGARALLGLDGFPAEDLLEVLGDHAREGQLTLRRWMLALRHVVRLAGGKERDLEQAQALGYKLFEQFADASIDDDSSAERTVSYIMFTVGLTCLCSSSVADKVAVACTLLDQDGDSCITIDQFEVLVLCMLRIIVAASTLAHARVSNAGSSLEELAGLVTREACRTFDLQEQDLLDVPKVLEITSDYVRLATL